jgi:hypothetical protein
MIKEKRKKERKKEVARKRISAYSMDRVPSKRKKRGGDNKRIWQMHACKG